MGAYRWREWIFKQTLAFQLINLPDPHLQPGIPLLLNAVGRHGVKGVRLAHQAYAGPGPGHGRVDEVAGHEHPGSVVHGNDDSRGTVRPQRIQRELHYSHCLQPREMCSYPDTPSA